MEKRKKVTTLEGQEGKITSRRRDGNTTRLVDNAIQILFAGHICVVSDHGITRAANQDLFKKILGRIRLEHPWLLDMNRLKIDKDKLELKILEEPSK